MNWDWLVPVVVSSLALLFTVGSFWWLHNRAGLLRTWEPRTYATALSDSGGDGKIVVQLPLVLHNGGATPIVVENMSLRLIETGVEALRLTAFHRQLYSPNEEREFATPFSVPGQSVVDRTFEFQRDLSRPVNLDTEQPQRFALWVKTAGEKSSHRRRPARWLANWETARWRCILEFEIQEPVWSKALIPRDSKGDDLPPASNSR
jgi:hypothetical protein